jgi:hypothetical protein
MSLYPLVYDDVDGAYIDRECPAWSTVAKDEIRRLGNYLPIFCKEVPTDEGLG